MALRLDELPNEILEIIFSFHVDPYRFYQSILTFRHINKTFHTLTDDQEGFWKVIMNQLRRKEYPEMYFPTHAFIDRLLFRTQKNKFNDFKEEPVVYNTKTEEMICYESDDETPNLFEKFAEWLDAYSTDEGILLKSMIQSCLGREMIAHIGMNQVGTLIELFFEKLLEPAVKFVNSWEEKPKEIEWNEQIVFNTNLLQVIETPSIFDEDIAGFWSELDSFYSCIPRKYFLYIVERFHGINARIDSANSSCLVTLIMKRLRDCGIKVERMRFSDVGSKKNFERTEEMESLVPPVSKSFYLQHLATWINSSTLLEWCLNVGTKFECALSHIANVPGLNVPLQAHVNTYIHDACGLTCLHYAVQSGNIELSKLLIEKYLANPFVQSKIEYNSHPLTPCTISQIDVNNSEKEQIYRLLQEKYGDVKLDIGTNEYKVKEVDRKNDTHKLTLEKMDAEVWYDEGEDYSTSVQWREKDEYIPLKEFITVETSDRRLDYDEYISDDSENEYGLSYEWVKNQIQNHKSCKRKRNPNNDYSFHESCKKIRTPIQELELVKWDMYKNELLSETNSYGYYDEDDERLSSIKILKRRPIEVDDEIESEPIGSPETEDDSAQTLGEEYILREDLTIPKKRMDLLIEETLMDFKNDSNVLPNGKMFIQQATEHFISNNFKIAQDIAAFSGRDYIVASDITLASQLVVSEKMYTDQFYGFSFNRRASYELKRYRDEFIEYLNIKPKEIRNQLEKFIKDETILASVVELIEEYFESTYLNEIQDEDMDENYDGESDHSSDSTYYSDDSMLSNVCLQEYFYGEDIGFYGTDLCYSTINTETFRNQRKEAIYADCPNYFTAHEKEGDLKTRLIYPKDRELALTWVNNTDTGFEFQYPMDQ